jgi:type I restriction enzyme S subunit
VFEMKDGKVAPLAELKRAAPERASKFTRATLKAGDILISKDGTIGRVAIVPPELEGGNITQHLVRASVHPFLNREFVAFTIRAKRSQDWLVGEKKGVALQGVNVEDFRRLPLPLAPLPEQQEIVRRVEGLFALADQLELRLAKARGQVEKLTPSLLARAFAGQLVPQDPIDEPAEKLLERIRQNEPRIARMTRMKKGKDNP